MWRYFILLTHTYYYKTDSFSPLEFAYQLSCFLKHKNVPLLFLCIGSDRITGDCLGPLTGYKLSTMNLPNCHILGTLDNPIHAGNLEETQHLIQTHYKEYTVIAIDASFGAPRHVNCLSLKAKPLAPGLGVCKNLPPTGDYSITGIISADTDFPYLTLQQIKLSQIMHMADCICDGILRYMQFRENALQFSKNTV